MNRAAGLLACLFAAFAAGAQDAGPVVTTSAGWTFSARDKTGGDITWTTEETAFAGLTARWGSSLELSGTVRSDFSGRSVTADDLLDQLALTWTANGFTILTAGKQRLSWGTARVFSAIDSLEPPLDPLDPKAKPRGVTGLKAELIPLDWMSVWVLALPAPRLDDAVLAARMDVLLEEADLSFGAVRSVSRPLTGLDGSIPTRGRRENPAVFANFAWFFDRFGFYGEAQYRLGRNRDWFLGTTLAALDSEAAWTARLTGGLQVEFPVWLNGTLRWLTEYHFNGEGFSESEAEAFRAAWNTRTGTATEVYPKGLSPGAYRRHYVYSGLSGLPLAEKFTAGVSALAGLDGGLTVVSTTLFWEVGQSLGVDLNWDRFDVWNGSPDRSELFFLPYRNRVGVSVKAWY